MVAIADWKDRVVNSAKSALPDLVAQTPIVGAAAKEVLSSLGYDQKIADSFFNSLLKKLSETVDNNFQEDGLGQEGGLSYARSGSKKSNFIVSRPVAAWLSSITHPNQNPLALKSLVIALLHERTWQCKDSADLYAHYTVMPLHAGISEITKRLQRIVKLAEEIRNFTLAAIAQYQPASLLFKSNNDDTTIQQFVEFTRRSDSFTESDHAECIALSTTPMLLIERYVDLFSHDGKVDVHYIPYIRPFESPSKDSPPMLRVAKSQDDVLSSPGLAVENIVRLNPFEFLDTAASQTDDHAWPYGREMEAGYINLKPPFELWCDFGKTRPPDWMDKNRMPDVVGVRFRGELLHQQEWEEYIQHTAPSLE